MLLLLLKADTLPQGHQMLLLLSAVYSSDEQARAWGWEAAQGRECHGSPEGLLSSCEDKPTTGHKDWLSITQPAPKREEIKKGSLSNVWLNVSRAGCAPHKSQQLPGQSYRLQELCGFLEHMEIIHFVVTNHQVL